MIELFVTKSHLKLNMPFLMVYNGVVKKGGDKMIDLKTIRLNHKMTQDELAEKVGVVRQNISNIECGLTKPSVRTAKAIAEILNFTWTDFFSDEEVIINDRGGENG